MSSSAAYPASTRTICTISQASRMRASGHAETGRSIWATSVIKNTSGNSATEVLAKRYFQSTNRKTSATRNAHRFRVP